MAGLALLAACGTASQVADETVTSFVTAGPPTSDAAEFGARRVAQPVRAEPPPRSVATGVQHRAAPAGDPAPRRRRVSRCRSGFVPKKLQPGEKPPQFIVVSFDGVGWHEKWQHWFDVGTAGAVPLHRLPVRHLHAVRRDQDGLPGPGAQPRQFVDQLEHARPTCRPRSPT